MMNKIVLIPDSFKGTMSSNEVCEIMKSCILSWLPKCNIVSIPVADGGEGSVDAFLAAVGGDKIWLEAVGPRFKPMRTFYGMLGDKKTAVIEMAACAGLPLMAVCGIAGQTTSYGVGQLILAAAKKGAERRGVGLGGSATNDGGCGAACAVGVKFFDENGREFIPVGDTLQNIDRIDMSGKSELLNGVEITAMCDIDNPMFGRAGAAYVFGPQKGADFVMVERLDVGRRHLYDVVKRDLGRDLASLPGGGAAGAMGVGMAAFFAAELKMGIETVLDVVAFDDVIADADLIFTGEGMLDSQSLHGKVVVGVAHRAAKSGKPVIAVVGGSELESDRFYEEGIKAIFTINRLPQDLSISREHSKENLAFTMQNILRLL